MAKLERPVHVVVLLLQGGLASTAVAPMEVFNAAGVLWNRLAGQSAEPLFAVQTASITGEGVASDGPLSLVPARAMKTVRKADLIIVPATGLATDELLARHGAVVPWLKRWYRRGAHVAGICSGVALLAEAGLLAGRPATTHWGLVDLYRQKYPEVDWQPERFVTECGNTYCGGGVYASLDLSLYLVEKFGGHELSVQCAKSLLIDTPRTWQSGYSAPPRRDDHNDTRIRKAQNWLYEHYMEDFQFETLAGQLGMSQRNFARRFKQATGESPLSYLHKLRIAQSKAMLEREQNTIQEVARAVGYEDLIFFRRLFKRHTGVSPQAYRHRFGARNDRTA
jgi:transcriptional regulator GlxA family with amidase domain